MKATRNKYSILSLLRTNKDSVREREKNMMENLRLYLSSTTLIKSIHKQKEVDVRDKSTRGFLNTEFWLYMITKKCDWNLWMENI